MGVPTTPNESDRIATLGTANEIVRAVENDEEGPHALPDFSTTKSWDGKISLLKTWWSGVDLLVFRLSQDLIDARAALEIACALLAKSGTGPNKEAVAAFAARLRAVDLPTQEEIDQLACSPAEPPSADIP